MVFSFRAKLARLCIASVLFGIVASQVLAADDLATPYYQPHDLVKVAPGRRLNLYCVGKGSPVVVFDYGWGGPPTTWEHIQPTIGRETTACTYDRAGYGFSDPGPLPRDTEAIVSDLHRLLVAAHLKPPYIFVGHSLAGLAGVLFADKYPSDLAGMVLVDPAFAHQDKKFDVIPGVEKTLANSKPDFKECIDVAKSQRLPKDARRIADCLDRDAQDSASARDVKDRWDMSEAHWVTLQSELASSSLNSDRDGAELDANKHDWGNLPLIVLTSSEKHFAGFPAREAALMQKIWWNGHQEVAARSTRGSNEEVLGSDHYIQIDHPSAVIAAIEKVLQMVKDNPVPPHVPR